MTAWLAAQGLLGIKNQWWILGLAVVAAISATVIAIADNAVEDTLDAARDAGAAVAIVKGHETTLQQAGAANEAGNEVRDDRGSARHDQCLRSATAATRRNCERFRNQPVPD